MDNDFEDYKNDVLDWADSEGVWDDDEEDEDIEEDYEDDDDFEIEDDVSMDDVAEACCVKRVKPPMLCRFVADCS